MMAKPFVDGGIGNDGPILIRAPTMPSRRRKDDPRPILGSDLKYLETQDSGYYSSSRPQFPETERETPSSRRRNLRKKGTGVTKYQIIDPDSDREGAVVVRQHVPINDEGKHRRYRSPERDWGDRRITIPAVQSSLPVREQQRITRPTTMQKLSQGMRQDHLSTAYQQSLQDVFPNQEYTDQVSYAQMQQPQRMHRPSMMQNRLQAAQQDYLRVDSPVSNPRQGSPSQSGFDVPAPIQRPQPLPTFQKQRTTISPKEVMLDEYDINEFLYNTPHSPDQAQITRRRSKSNSASSFNPFSQESTGQIPQQYPFVSQPNRQSRDNALISTIIQPGIFGEPSGHGLLTDDHSNGILLANTDGHKSVAVPLAARRARAGFSTTDGDYTDNPGFRFLPRRSPFGYSPESSGRRPEIVYPSSPEEAIERVPQHTSAPSNTRTLFTMASEATEDHALRTSAQTPDFIQPKKSPEILVNNALRVPVTSGKSSTASAASPPMSTLPPKPSSRRRHKAQKSSKDVVIEVPVPRSYRRQQSRGNYLDREVRKDTVPLTKDYDFLNHFSEYGAVAAGSAPSFPNWGDISSSLRSPLNGPRNNHQENKGIWAPYTISEDRTGNTEAVSHLLLAALCRKEYSLADFNKPRSSGDEESQSSDEDVRRERFRREQEDRRREEVRREQPNPQVGSRARRYSIYSSDEDSPVYDDKSDPDNTTVCVGGLSGYVTEDELRSFFQGFGEITYVKIPPGKGRGFVEFVQRHAAEMAISQMQGYPIGNSRVRLSWGRSQNNSGYDTEDRAEEFIEQSLQHRYRQRPIRTARAPSFDPNVSFYPEYDT